MHDAQSMNPNNFSDPLISHLAPTAGQNAKLRWRQWLNIIPVKHQGVNTWMYKEKSG